MKYEAHDLVHHTGGHTNKLTDHQLSKYGKRLRLKVRGKGLFKALPMSDSVRKESNACQFWQQSTRHGAQCVAEGRGNPADTITIAAYIVTFSRRDYAMPAEDEP